MTVWIGTSGWQYRDWRERFYPTSLPQRAWLEHYASAFRTVEVNNTFYRLPSAETFRAWRQRTPDDLVLACKASRYLTHVKRLAEPQEPIARLMNVAVELGDKLGPVLLQLPPTFRADHERLDAVLAAFPAAVRVAVELRHDSWWSPTTRGLLERRGAALVWADRGSRLLTPTWRTAEWGYVRFHEGAAKRWPCYGRTALAGRAARVAATFGDADVYAYFNNDPGGCALRDARLFALACRRAGLATTRVPAAGQVRLDP